VGLDVSKKLTSICVLDRDGRTVAESAVPTEPKQILSFLRGKRRRYTHVGLEAGSISSWLREELARRGLPAVCIETRHAHKVLSARRNKTDKNDARGIAELMRLGSFRAVHEKSLESRQIKAVLTARRMLLQKRLDLDGAIGALLMQAGHKLGSSRTRAFEERVLAFVRHDPFLTPLLKSLLVARKCIAEQADALTQRASEIASCDPICRRLMTAPGIGPLTALEYRAAIDDPARFGRSRTVPAHLGLTPKTHQSGDVDRRGRITRCGDPALRASLFMAARTVILSIKRPSSLRTWGLEIAARRGKNKAIVAVARRLALILHSMWRSGSDFQWEAGWIVAQLAWLLAGPVSAQGLLVSMTRRPPAVMRRCSCEPREVGFVRRAFRGSAFGRARAESS
jgi:transposase